MAIKGTVIFEKLGTQIEHVGLRSKITTETTILVVYSGAGHFVDFYRKEDEQLLGSIPFVDLFKALPFEEQKKILTQVLEGRR